MQAIADPRVRDQVSRAIAACDDALEVVDALDLAPHELATSDLPSLGTWNALAPDVRGVLMAVHRASAQLSELFPPPPEMGLPELSGDLDLDLAFSLMEDGTQPPPIRDRRDQEIDALVGGVDSSQTFEEVGGVISALAGMLQSDFVSFGQRLQNPAVVGDRWFLLSELQELRQKCSQCLEAVVATVLKSLAGEDLEEVLPRYQSAARRAQGLREAVVDLEQDVRLLNEQAQRGGVGDLAAIRQGLILRLNEFAEEPAYAHVRPLDKQQIIQFRRLLSVVEPTPETVGELRRGLEGFSKFLEVMHAINDRDVLLKADRSNLQMARMLLESEEGLARTRPHLEAVYGRDPTLDVYIRQVRDGFPVELQTLLEAVQRAEDTLRAGGAW